MLTVVREKRCSNVSRREFRGHDPKLMFLGRQSPSNTVILYNKAGTIMPCDSITGVNWTSLSMITVKRLADNTI